MQRERDCDWSQRLVSDRVCVSERVCGRECVGESVWERVCGRVQIQPFAFLIAIAL